MGIITPSIAGDIVQYDIITWPGMAAADTGAPVDVAKYGELSIVALGDATTVAIEGSNDSGSTFSALGAGVTLTIAASKTPVTRIAEHPQFLRPNVTGGTNTKVILVGRKIK